MHGIYVTCINGHTPLYLWLTLSFFVYDNGAHLSRHTTKSSDMLVLVPSILSQRLFWVQHTLLPSQGVSLFSHVTVPYHLKHLYSYRRQASQICTCCRYTTSAVHSATPTLVVWQSGDSWSFFVFAVTWFHLCHQKMSCYCWPAQAVFIRAALRDVEEERDKLKKQCLQASSNWNHSWSPLQGNYLLEVAQLTIKVRTLTDQLTTNQQAAEAKLCELEKIRDEHENELCKENQQLKDQLTKERAEMTGKLKQTDAKFNKIRKLKEQQDTKFRMKKEKLQVKLEALKA